VELLNYVVDCTHHLQKVSSRQVTIILDVFVARCIYSLHLCTEAMHYAARDSAIQNPSVRPSVRISICLSVFHAPVLSQN